MMGRLVATVACVLVSLPAFAQDAPPSPGAGTRFVRDVLADYRHFVSADTLLWLRIGGGGALGIHAADEALRDESQALGTLEGGQEFGGAIIQIPLAVGWWMVGHAAGGTHGEAGRDLVRAQISATSWTYALKYAVRRTRPNGDPRSFPSGHASSSFATATVLQQHYGWKLGVPAFAAAGYTAASRIPANKHWASDVLFGAFMGIASARTVTVRLREARVSIGMLTTPGGAGVLVTAMR
jgi:membrane-associated phospholipid phosphatase